MANKAIKIEDAQNNPWQDLMFRFDGSWMPDIDGALIGPNNYQTLENLRYKDSGLEGINGYSKINTTAITTYTKIRSGIQLRTSYDQDSYVFVNAVASTGQGRVLLNRTTPGDQGDFQTAAQVAAGTVPPLDTSGNEYFADTTTDLIGRFSEAPQGNITYCNGKQSMIFGGDEQKVAACFSCTTTALALPIDVTRSVKTALTTESYTISAAVRPATLIMTTRPIQAIKFYVGTANAAAGTLTVKTWTGATFGSDLVDTDNTIAVAGKPLGQTGIVTFSAHTDGTAKLKHFEELYLYAYLVELAGAGTTAGIYQITVDYAFQSIKDVWDGVYRQPIQWQVFDVAAGNVYFDYTLQVNEASDVNAPVGGLIDGLTSSDKIYVMFVEQVAGIKMTMLGSLVNVAASVISVKYWTGDAFAAVNTLVDGTIAVANTSFSQSGLLSWTPTVGEVPLTRFGSFGYIYEISLSGTLTGTKLSTAEVLVDICTGIPQAQTIEAFDFGSIYGTRLMLGGFSEAAEGNRMDYSVANAPDAFNGFDSSDFGNQSLYFGGVEPIVAATQIYNRFGASVYAMLLVLKRNETYILVGNTPDDFVIYDVAKTIGCVAPLSLATAEVGLDLGNGLTRNVAIWLSHSGPMMFDGAVLSPIPGVRSYFDPNDARYIDFDLVKKAVGWVNPNYKEYNLLIPSGSATLNNVWLVYDLLRRKWFTKDTDQAQFPQTGFEIGEPDTGRRYVYGGIDIGHMIMLEDGPYWDDGTAAGIAQKVKTGDFFPTKNPWDETSIRKFKIFIKRLASSSVTNNLEVTYYTNTELSAGAGAIWEDGNTASGIHVSWADITDGVSWASGVTATINLNLDVGLQRLIRVIQDLNRKGWAHALEFAVTTTDVPKGFQPVLWGIQYRIERKDNTSTT